MTNKELEKLVKDISRATDGEFIRFRNQLSAIALALLIMNLCFFLLTWAYLGNR